MGKPTSKDRKDAFTKDFLYHPSPESRWIPKKDRLCQQDKSGLFCQRVTKGRRIAVKVSKSSASAPFDKLEFDILLLLVQKDVHQKAN